MKESRRTNVKVGITVIFALAIFIWILGWAKRVTVAGDYYTLNMRFNSVSGLEIGDHITVNGVKKGKVTDIKIVNDNVIVVGEIPKDIVLKSDATARVEMMDLMGGKKIEITPGSSSEFFDLGQELRGRLATDIPGALQMIGNVESELKTIIIDMKFLLEKLSKNLSDEEMIANLRLAVINSKNIAEKLDKLLTENRDEFNQLSKNTVELTSKMNKFLDENTSTISSTFNETHELVIKLNDVTLKLDKFLSETENQSNILGKLIYDEKTYENLVNSLNKLNEITTILLEQMKSSGIKVDTKIRLFE